MAPLRDAKDMRDKDIRDGLCCPSVQFRFFPPESLTPIRAGTTLSPLDICTSVHRKGAAMVARRFVPGLSVIAALTVILTACSQAPAPGAAPPSSGSKEPEGAQAKWEQTLQAAKKEGAVV